MYVFDTLIVLAQFGFSDVRQYLYGIVLIFIYTMVIDKILVMGAQKNRVKKSFLQNMKKLERLF